MLLNYHIETWKQILIRLSAVYAAISALSFLIILNIAPFAHRMHGGLTFVVVVVFIVMLVYSWTVFPFTREAPLRTFFQQRLDLEIPTYASPHGPVIHTETLLTAPHDFVDHIIPALPSSFNKELTCETDNRFRKGLRTCRWDSRSLLPSPGESDAAVLARNNLTSTSHATRASDWLAATFKRKAGYSATVTIRGVNTRTCRLQFDAPISSYYVHGSSGRMQPGYEVPPEGITDLVLWSREWDREFVVDIQWNGTQETMEGRASCEWMEYASGTAGGPHAVIGAQIPALEELIRFAPLWAIPTKWTIGLVEAGGRFSV